jgi:acetyl-CoA synthetase
MSFQFNQFLKNRTGTDRQWQWTLPEKFNIAQACVTQHVEKSTESAAKTALIVEDHDLGTKTLSYAELEQQSAQLAEVFAEHKLAREDRVLIRLPNSTEYPVSFFACLRYGAIAVPTSTLLAPSEVAYLAKDSGAKVLITSKNMWSELKPEIIKQDKLRAVYLTGTGDMPQDCEQSNLKVFDFNQLLASSPHSLKSTSLKTATMADTSPNDPAYLVYTSGTTGHPKGVLHAHRSLIGRLPASQYWFDFKDGDRIMHSGKFNWTYVLGSALMDPLFHGHCVIVHEGPNDASTWPKLIKKHGCSIFIGVPTIYRQIIQKTDFTGADVPSLRHCMSAGEHLSDEMLSAWQTRFSMDIYEAIGMSEFSYYISQNKQQPIKPGAAGFIQPGHQVELLNSDNRPVGTNEEGMIAVNENDPGLFLRYWQLPEQTQQARHDGYFYTGDYASRDEQGYIWFLGRKDDIINSFGYRISPHEIERVIKTHPEVADCVALGIDIEKNKTLVGICVIKTPDAKLTEEALLAFGQQHLAKYKAPKIIHFCDDFPRTKNGKVLRKQLLSSLTK